MLCSFLPPLPPFNFSLLCCVLLLRMCSLLFAALLYGCTRAVAAESLMTGVTVEGNGWRGAGCPVCAAPRRVREVQQKYRPAVRLNRYLLLFHTGSTRLESALLKASCQKVLWTSSHNVL